MRKVLGNIANSIKKACDKTSYYLSKLGDCFFAFLKKYDKVIYLVTITILSLVLRYTLLDCVRGDFKAFLKPWYTKIYEGGFEVLGTTFGDYTPSYYYLLYFISLFKIDPESMMLLHAIKWISIVFDYALAIFASLICYELTKNKIKTLICYTSIVFGLTVFLNSALWGQCDAIYVTFCVASFYFILKNKPHTSMIMYGFAFAFKVQSIFILPVYLVMFLRRKFKLRYLLWVPFVYLIMALPASFAAENFGTRFGEIWAIFFNQSANSYSQLTLNAGSFYALIFTNFKAEDFISAFSLFLAIAIVGTYIFMIYRSKEEFSKKTWLKILVIFAMIFPYFLPHMHERYFYLVDIVICIYALINPKKFYVAILAILNSMIGYMVYLWNIPFINVVPQEQSDPTKALSFRFGAIIYLIAIIIVSIDLFKEIYPNGLIEEDKKVEEN